MRRSVLVWKCAAAVIGALVLAGPVDAAQGGQKLDYALRNAKSGGSQRVIVRSQSGRLAELRQLLRSCGAKIQDDHSLIDALSAEVKNECLQKLLANDVLESVGSDAEVFGDLSESYDLTTIAPNTLRRTLGASEYATGAGIGIAIIDSGIAPLPAFGSRIIGFYDFTKGGVVATTPNDEYGHGTHVAGLIGAYDSAVHGSGPGGPAARLEGARQQRQGAHEPRDPRD